MIPARLGSKRIKKKNLRLIDGLPLIQYIINGKLITIIGERHISRYHECASPQISVAKYIALKIKYEPTVIEALLEYPPGEEVKYCLHSLSINMKETCVEMEKHGLKNFLRL